MKNSPMGKRGSLVVVCVWVAVLLAGSAGAEQSSSVSEIRALEMKMLECYKHRQVEVFATVLDDDFVITFEDGSTYSKTGYLAYSASSSTRIELAEISEMKVRVHGDTAIVTGVYHEKGTDSHKSYDYRDRFTDVWMKKVGKWSMIAAHYSVPTK